MADEKEKPMVEEKKIKLDNPLELDTIQACVVELQKIFGGNLIIMIKTTVNEEKQTNHFTIELAKKIGFDDEHLLDQIQSPYVG